MIPSKFKRTSIISSSNNSEIQTIINDIENNYSFSQLANFHLQQLIKVKNIDYHDCYYNN